MYWERDWVAVMNGESSMASLVPPASRIKEIERDYEEMRREMIFGDAPELSAVLAVLQEIENRVNAAK